MDYLKNDVVDLNHINHNTIQPNIISLLKAANVC